MIFERQHSREGAIRQRHPITVFEHHYLCLFEKYYKLEEKIHIIGNNCLLKLPKVRPLYMKTFRY